MARGGRWRSSLRQATAMTVRNWRRCWMAFASHDSLGVDDRGPAQIGSSLTRATATRAVVGCSACGRSRTRFRSAAISGHVARPDLVARWPSTRRPTRVATSWSAASTASSSGAGSPRASRSAWSTTERWSSSPPSFSGSTPDSSDKRSHVYPQYTVASAIPFALLPAGRH